MFTIGVGTEKGAFLLCSDDREVWSVSAPVLGGWRVTTFGRTPSGDHLLATGSNWYGAAIHRSVDFEEWEQVVDGPAWPDGSNRTLKNVWTIAAAGDRLFAGVDDAGLFSSDDDGRTWWPMAGFNEHETRGGWEPGFGGLSAHRILIDASNPDRMWAGVSAVGVFRSDDGGASWRPVNDGVEKTSPSDEFDDIGFCIHCLVADPAQPNTIWRQDHSGVYRTGDGGESWDRIESGLPARFGFPIDRDPMSGALFVVPLQSDEVRLPVDGRLRVYRSTDGGDSWAVSGTGHPGTAFHAGVLRDAMSVDGRGGVYVGTTAGTVHHTADGGDTWSVIPEVFPRILSVAVLEA